MADTCKTCRWFADLPEGIHRDFPGAGQCMLNPPVGLFTYEYDRGTLRVGRPLTFAALSCGEHQPRLHQPKEETR
jgi:hypothetical protein